VKGIRPFRGQGIRGEVQVYLKVATTICTIYDVPQADSGRLRLSRKAGVKSQKMGVKIRSQQCILKNQKSKAGVGKAATQ
jgi:hypothetical protein